MLIVTADDKSRPFGAANPELTASYTGFVRGQTLTTSGVEGALDLSTTATASSAVATYPIDAEIGTLTATNYAFTLVDGMLTVTTAATTTTVSPQSVDEGSSTTVVVTVVNPSVTDADVAPTGTVALSATGTLALGSLSCTLAPTETPGSSSCSVDTTGTDNAGGTIVATFDGDAGHAGSSASGNITVSNVAPSDVTISLSLASIVEHDSVTLTGSFVDPGSADSHTVTITWGDGKPDTVLNLAAGVTTFAALPREYVDDNPTATPTDPNTVTVVVTDKDGATGQNAAPVQVANAAPKISSVTGGPTMPLTIGSTAGFTVNFTDVGSEDTHTCKFTWDDGETTTVNAAGAGDGSCTAAHTFTTAGVYTVGFEVQDDDTGQATTTFEFVVIYDPTSGFVTGGGWINSAPGAYIADPSLTGKATFGFVSKYEKGMNVPTGQTEFQFQVGNLNFHSTAYEWLVVSGDKAQYKGTGTINGSGDYSFMLTATDGGSRDVDKFRIKIVDRATGMVVYDNKRGDPDDLDNATPQAIAGGNIVVHNK